jgi:hypothetical protein
LRTNFYHEIVVGSMQNNSPKNLKGWLEDELRKELAAK